MKDQRTSERLVTAEPEGNFGLVDDRMGEDNPMTLRDIDD
jgi:hypothetical protein